MKEIKVLQNTYLKAYRKDSKALPAVQKVALMKGERLFAERMSDEFDGHYALTVTYGGHYYMGWWLFAKHVLVPVTPSTDFKAIAAKFAAKR
jgi:hypothetical protein